MYTLDEKQLEGVEISIYPRKDRKNPEKSIAFLYKEIIRKLLSEKVETGTLSKKDFLKNIENFLQEISKKELAIIAKEKGFSFLEIDKIIIPYPFLKRVAKKIEENISGFLERLESSIKSDFFQRQITTINEARIAVEKMKTEKMDSVFYFLEKTSKKKFYSDFYLDSGNLFFMIFFQYELRYAIQDFFIFNLIINDIEEKKEYLNDAYKEIASLLQEDLKNTILSNGHLEALAEEYGISDSVRKKINAYKQKSESALKKISKILREKNISINFLHSLNHVSYTHISDRMRLLQQGYNLKNYYYWSQTDIGHGFKDNSNMREFLLNKRNSQEYEKKKIAKAMIFEDDPQQMKIYEILVQECTPYKPDVLISRTKDVYQHLFNEEIQYFLLDIENGKDRTAGIEVARKILKYFLKRKITDSSPEIYIKLWSSSKNALKQAWDELSMDTEIKKYLEAAVYFTSFDGKVFEIREKNIMFSLNEKRYNPKDFQIFYTYELAKEILS